MVYQDKYRQVNPPEKPDKCHKCGSPVWSKGESGYYDVCNECHNEDASPEVTE